MRSRWQLTGSTPQRWPTSGVYPSVEWVRGYRVGVPADEAERAREVLDALSGRADVAKVDEADAEGEDRP